jgi:hypothetical protein
MEHASSMSRQETHSDGIHQIRRAPLGDNEMNELPVVRLELQHMQHSICMMINEHMMKLDSEAQAAVKAAVASFDYSGEVRKITHEAIRDALKRAIELQFRYDSQPYQAIKTLAEQMVKKALKAERSGRLG